MARGTFVVLALLLGASVCAADDFWSHSLSSDADFDNYAVSVSTVMNLGKSLKFLVDRRDAANPVTYIIDSNYKVDNKTPEYVAYHYLFAQKVLHVEEDLETFNKETYFTQDKRFFAGTIQAFNIGTDDQAHRAYGIQLYPSDIGKEQVILDLVRAVLPAIKIPNADINFIAASSGQSCDTVKADLLKMNVRALTIEDVLASVDYIPLNSGEAWGYLRMFPASQDDLTPADIAVFDELPLTLSVVAGVVTKSFQTELSHINLKSRERNTPNMVLRDVSVNHEAFASLIDKPVHLVVRSDGFTLTLCTEQEVADKVNQHFNRPWIPTNWQRETRLLSFDDMCKASPRTCLTEASKKFGSKAANLGFLCHPKVLGRASQASTMSAKFGYDLTPQGFGIPIQFYADFVAYPANGLVRGLIAELIKLEESNLVSNRQRSDYVDRIQNAILLNSTIPPDALKQVNAQIKAVLPGLKKFKVRSSASAEDIPGFDGAGLYDSYTFKNKEKDNADMSCTVRIEGGGAKSKMVPATLNCAIKGVYASLWNKRAIEERSYARLNHTTAAMGLGLLSQYDEEAEVAANSVVVTRLNDVPTAGYSLAIQKGNNLVTNPDAGTYAEGSMAIFGDVDEPTVYSVQRFAKPYADRAPLTTQVLSNDLMAKMVDIATQVERSYCQFVDKNYIGGEYDARSCPYVEEIGEKVTALDMEFKYGENDKFICKQVREFHG